MNDGLMGFPSVVRPGIEATYVAQTEAVYAVNPEPTSDSVMLGADGNPMELRFFLQSPRTVQIRVNVLVRKGDASHTLRCSLYDNGTKIAPGAALSGTGWHSWFAGSVLQQVQFDTILGLDAGQHVVDFRRQAVSGTSVTTFGSRILIAEVLAP